MILLLLLVCVAVGRAHPALDELARESCLAPPLSTACLGAIERARHTIRQRLASDKVYEGREADAHALDKLVALLRAHHWSYDNQR